MTGFLDATQWKRGGKRKQDLPECGRCGLYKRCASPKMLPTAQGSRRVLIVAEAPGEEEDKRGKHLVGKLGQRLRRDLARLGLDLGDCAKTNAIICHPPTGEIKEVYVESCRPNLLKTIREFKPKVIILLGGHACRSLLPTEKEGGGKGGIKKWAGWTIPSHETGAWICPSYHPAYLMRMDDPVLDRLFKQHMMEALKLEKVKLPKTRLEDLTKCVELIESPRVGRLRMKDLLKKEGVLAFDYESNSLKPEGVGREIVCVSFCHEEEGTFSTMLDADSFPILSKVLRKKELKKVAANLKHEERWTRHFMGHGIKGWYWDTMLASHCLDNRQGITSLKFQAFVHFGVADYEENAAHFFKSEDNGLNRIREMPIKELLLYNGLDSLLTYMLMLKQRKAMRLPCE